MTEQKTWLTASEAADHAGLTRGTILEALALGDLKGAQLTKPGGRWRIKRDWVDEWLTAKAEAA